MLIIGLTGGIATGKSTVSSLLATHNIPIIDADILARAVVAPGTPALSAITLAFSPSILLPDGSLDRKKLGDIIFADPSKRTTLNRIVHPAVRRAMLTAVLKCWLKGEKCCVLDVPLLIESGIHKWVGKVVVVYCSPELQLTRLMARDGSTAEAASARLRAQLPITAKVAYADTVLDNSGSRKELDEHVVAFVRKLHASGEIGGWRWVVNWLVPPIGLAAAAFKLLWRTMKREKRAGRRSNGLEHGS